MVTFLTPVSIFKFSSGLQQQKSNVNTTSPNTTVSNDFKTYINPVFGIKMKYPSNWLKFDLYDNISSGLLIVFKSPPQTPAGSLNIIAENTSLQNSTFSKLVSTKVNNLKQSGMILSLIAESRSSFSGHPAYKIVYTTMSTSGIKLQAMQLIALIGNRSYFITYATPSENYSTYLPIMQSMINSISVYK